VEQNLAQLLGSELGYQEKKKPTKKNNTKNPQTKSPPHNSEDA